MKKILIIALLITVPFAIFTIRNNTDLKIIISKLERGGRALPAQELKYRIYFLGILPLADAVFSAPENEEYNGQKVYHLNTFARTSALIAKLFSGSITLDSYIDIKQFNPVLFKQRLAIKDKGISEKEALYDQAQRTILIDRVKRQIFPNTQDPLSAIFNIRRMDFDKIKEFEMNINTNQKNYILKATSSDKDIVVNGKPLKMAILKGEIYRRDKNPYHRSNITMVLLKDKENIPVSIKIFSGGVLLNAKLIDTR